MLMALCPCPSSVELIPLSCSVNPRASLGQLGRTLENRKENDLPESLQLRSEAPFQQGHRAIT